MLRTTKIFPMLINPLQGLFAGLFLGQMVHLFTYREATSAVEASMAIVGLLLVALVLLRGKIRKYIFMHGNVLWVQQAAPIFYLLLLILFIFPLLFTFDDKLLIISTLQFGSMLAFGLIVAESYLFSLQALRNVYAHLLKTPLVSAFKQNISWWFACLVSSLLYLNLLRLGEDSLGKTLGVTIMVGFFISFLLLICNVKIFKTLKNTEDHVKQNSVSKGERTEPGKYFSNPYDLERNLETLLKNAGTDDRFRLLSKIRHLPLIDGIGVLEALHGRVFPGDKDFEISIEYLNKIRNKVQDKGDSFDFGTENSLMEIKASIRQAIAGGNPILVQKFINDNRAEVKKAAILASIKFSEPSIIPALVGLLCEQEYAFAARLALSEYGDRCLPFLRAARYRHKNNSFFMVQCLVLVEGFQSRDAADFLVETLNDSQKSIQFKAAQGLIKLGYPLTGLQKTQIRNFVENLIGNIAIQREILSFLEVEDRQLIEALEEEIEEKTASLFMLLTAFVSPAYLAEIQEMLKDEPERYRLSIFTYVDLFFPLGLRSKCKILFGSNKTENIAAALQPEYHNHQICFKYKNKPEAIKQILKLDYGDIGFWLRACALKKLGAIPGQQISLLLLAEVFNQNQLMQEVAAQVLFELNYDYYFLQMQRLPPENAKKLKYKIENTISAYGFTEEVENQLLFDKINELREFPICEQVSYENLVLQSGLFSLRIFDHSKSKINYDPYRHHGYWLVAEGSFSVYHWGALSFEAKKGDVVDMSFLVETDDNSLTIDPESEIKIYFIEYYAFNDLYLKCGHSAISIIQPLLERPKKVII